MGSVGRIATSFSAGADTITKQVPMTGRIYSLKHDGSLDAMDETPYDSERVLQQLLEKHPHLLAGEQINPDCPPRWVLISREMPVPDEEDASGKWWLDHLFLDQEAVPTLVEVKRSTNKEVRRKVVGQLLDYAANAVIYWPVETIRAKFEAACEQRGVDPDEHLIENIHPDSEEEVDVDAFWKRLQVNLRAGKLRLVFVADEIPRELQRIVEFLNEQMERTEVLALEVKQYTSEGRTTLVPRVIGLKDKGTGGGPRGEAAWNKERFFQALSKKASPSAQDVVQKLYGWAESTFSSIKWSSGRQGKLFAQIKHKGVVCPMTIWTSGRIVVRFARLSKKAPFNDETMRKEFRERLQQIPGVAIPDDKLDGFFGFDAATLAGDADFTCFTDAFQWVVREIETT